MNVKSKLFSLLLVGLLLLPVLIIAPKSGGQVLGETELATSSTSSIPAEIGSGVREVRDPAKSASTSEIANKISGNIIWDENQVVDVSTNKFNLGKSVVVKTPSSQLNLVVNAVRPDLASEIVMVVNRETFVRLGGNPDKDTNLVASAWADN